MNRIHNYINELLMFYADFSIIYIVRKRDTVTVSVIRNNNAP